MHCKQVNHYIIVIYI